VNQTVSLYYIRIFQIWSLSTPIFDGVLPGIVKPATILASCPHSLVDRALPSGGKDPGSSPGGGIFIDFTRKGTGTYSAGF
jgi:hypothetical protein